MPASAVPVPVPVSGTQFELSFGDYRASIASVGASLRALTFAGRDLVRGFGADELRPAYRGVLLAPWPNRVIDARYEWEGQTHQLAVSEPARGHALHGLVVWHDFAAIAVSETAVTLTTTIVPQAGYPHRVRVAVTYRLDADGLHTEVDAENLGPGIAPFGWGSHSYLVAPGDRVDQWHLDLPAATVQEVTPDRLIPTGLAPVAETGFDFRDPRQITTTEIDHAFTDLAFTTVAGDTAEYTRVRLVDAAGVGAEMTWDARCPWVQIHTADLPDAELSRRCLAVEPMTCPPGAFNDGTDVLALRPGQHSTGWWLIGAAGPS